MELPAGLQNAVDENPAGLARFANYDVIMDYDFQGRGTHRDRPASSPILSSRPPLPIPPPNR